MRPRVIPALLLRGQGLVKTVRFKDPTYVGDPINTVRIFNDKEVDEIVVLDTTATIEKRPPRFDLIREIAGECFMPMAYGGGVRTLQDAVSILHNGSEKVVINSAASEDPLLVRTLAKVAGSQSVVVSIDVKQSFLGKYEVYSHGGRKKTGRDPVKWAQEVEGQGAGEIFLTSIDRDGLMQGYDLELIQRVCKAVSVPVIACGGAGNLAHLQEALQLGGASAVAAGSMFVFQGKHRAVLITYPSPDELDSLLGSDQEKDSN
ncbi:MAG: AglZ/HisF2 family acetamidino modification protein [Pseudomonadota bacterium]